jgi:hypothetical protein
MLFLLAEYYIEGEGVMNKVTVMIRAKLNGKYPYVTAVVNGKGCQLLSSPTMSPHGRGRHQKRSVVQRPLPNDAII